MGPESTEAFEGGREEGLCHGGERQPDSLQIAKFVSSALLMAMWFGASHSTSLCLICRMELHRGHTLWGSCEYQMSVYVYYK